MLLKLLLAVLIVAMLISLTGALKSLFKDAGNTETDHTFRWLRLRVGLAVAIIVVIAIGVLTGEFSPSAPWSGRY